MRVYKREGSTRWYCFFRIGEKQIQRVLPGARTKSEAERAAHALYTELAGQHPDSARLTFGEFLPEYLRWARLHKKTAEAEVGLSPLWLTFFGERTLLAAIGVRDIARYQETRLATPTRVGSKLRSTASVNREHAQLSSLFTLAKTRGLLKENPCAGVKYLKRPESTRFALTPPQIQRLLTALADQPQHHAIVELAILTGMRRGELLGLRWEEVRFGEQVIALPGSRTKNGKARRIPLSQRSLEILKLRRKQSLGRFVWASRLQTLVPPRTISFVFHRACRAAGLAGYPFHGLRHTAATLMGRVTDVFTLCAILGWDNIEQARVYCHPDDSESRRAVEVLAGATKMLPIRGEQARMTATIPAE